MKIIAIHGAGMNEEVFSNMPFGTVTLPGHGMGGDCLPSVPEMARWVCTQMGPEPVLLMGHSMGALVALAAAADHRVKGVILLGAALEMPVNADLLSMAQTAPDDARQLLLKWSIAKDHPRADDLRGQLLTSMRNTSEGALYTDLAACNQYQEGRSRAKDLQKPALVLTGSLDKMAPAARAEEMAAVLPKAFLVVVNGAGHMVMLEKPAETLNEINKFSQSIQG